MSSMNTSEVFSNDDVTSGRVQAPPSKRPREDSEEVLEMREDVRQLRGDIGGIYTKLEVVLDAVGRVAQELEGMRGTVAKILICTEGHEVRLKKMEQTLSKQTEEMTAMKRATTNLDKRTQKLEERLKKNEDELNNIRDKLKGVNETKWMAINNEARSRRNNLLFYGIPEKKDEDCTASVNSFFKQQLKINEPVVIQRAHRHGKPTTGSVIGQKAGRPRPIIVNFLDYRQRELIRAARFKLTQPYGIAEDFPIEIRKAREQLLPQLRELKQQGKKCGIVWPARLIICENRIIDDIDVTAYSRK